MVLEARLQQTVLLKKVVDAMRELCKDVHFDCNEKGLQVQSMDSSHVALVSLMLRDPAFAEFKCDRPTPHRDEHRFRGEGIQDVRRL